MKQALLKNQLVATFWKIVQTRIFLSAAISLIIATVTLNFNLLRIEAYFYDLHTKWSMKRALDSKIELLAISDNEDGSIENHLKALTLLIKSKPAAIAYLNKFDHSDVQAHGDIAAKFLSLANKAQAEGIKIFLGTDIDLSGEMLPPYPLSLLPHSPAILHKDGTMFGEDKITRRALLTALNEPSLHLRITKPNATKTELLQTASEMRGSYFYKPGNSWHALIHYPQNTTNPSNYPVADYKTLLGKEWSPEKYKGKIVLVDFVRSEELNDFNFTPFERSNYTNARIFTHAAILNTLLKNNAIKILSNKIDVVITFLLTILLSFITVYSSPARGVLAVLLAGIFTFIMSHLLFSFAGIWLKLVHPLLALFSTYYLVVPYRAILEYKKRWEVQQKHDLLVQVEEMKGNFMSLMSHDLKTPVARIQGLAEVVLKQGSLSEAQESEVQQIIDSTESLDKFISKILNLTKIESSEIKLNPKSKDINKIIEGCVEKLSFQAKRKNITLNLQLDPLFPIYIDAALMIQVLTNLIDNAIKYSPENTSVEICSREHESQIEITVKDSGSGIDEHEMEHVFTKFFRSRDRIDDQIKGSGLGLYLAKYFIELHNGKIFVESQKGRGSTFTIHLPLQAN